VLTSDTPLQQNAAWHKSETFAIAGASVTGVVLDPLGKTVSLTTDKAWSSLWISALGATEISLHEWKSVALSQWKHARGIWRAV